MKIYTNRKKIKPKHNRVKKQDPVTLTDFLYKLFMIISVVAMGIAYAAAYINPVKFYPPLYFGLYYIPILCLNILMLFFGLVRRSKGVILSIIIILPALIHSNTFYKAGQEVSEHSGDSFTMISYNVGRFSNGKNDMQYAKIVENILDFINKQDCDIVCLQEFETLDMSKIQSMFPNYKYIHFSSFKDNEMLFGNITLSKYEILNQADKKFAGSTNEILIDDIKINDDTVRLYNCHLESYSISAISREIKEAKSNISQSISVLQERLKYRTIARAKQVEDIIFDISSHNGDTIICGDFNDPPTSYTYHSLAKDRTDTFVKCGSGFSATYSKLWPLLRIDYIIIPNHFDCSDYSMSRIPYSDHYPISTTIYYN